MQRYLAVLVLVAFTSGCLASQRTPDATVLPSLRTIAVIPVEPPEPPERSPWLSGNGTATPLDVLVWVSLLIYLTGLAVQEGREMAALPEGTLTVERGGGVPTAGLAQMAAEILQPSGGRTVYLVDGYLRLPRVDRSQYPIAVASEGQARIQRWYNEDVTAIDYRSLGREGLDAILEVAILGDLKSTAPKGHVLVRLGDPTTKQVLGRAEDWPFRGSVETKARDLVTECLKDLGLIAE